jgi:hypothetical protein
MGPAEDSAEFYFRRCRLDHERRTAHAGGDRADVTDADGIHLFTGGNLRRGGPIFGEEGFRTEFTKLWLNDVRITNRSPDPVSLRFDLAANVAGRTIRLAPHICSDEQTQALKCFDTPLAIPAKSPAVGTLVFLGYGPFEVWDREPAVGDPILTFVLTVTDDVSGKQLPVRIPTPRSFSRS